MAKNSDSEIFNLIKKILLNERKVLSSKEIYEVAIEKYSEEVSKFESKELSKTFAGMLSKEVKVKNPRFVRFNIDWIEKYCVKWEHLDQIKNWYENYLLNNQELDEINSYIESDRKKLLNLFWTQEKLEKLDLNSYCIWKWSDNNFSYLLERWTQKLWSIRWWTASKFWVYYNKEKEKYMVSKYFSNEKDAIENIKNEIINIAFKYSLDEVVWSSVLSSMLKYKTYYIYNPDKIIPIYWDNYLKNILSFFWIIIDNFLEWQKLLISIFNSISDSKKSTLNFMYYLNSVNIIYIYYSNIKQKIDKQDFYNILISLETSNFLIFSWPSWTWKSSIIEKLADILDWKYKKIAIKSNYYDESSLLWYWNPLLSKYEWTETLQFLIDAYKDKDNWLTYFLLLDEMNLSRIENYFSYFLARLDELKDSEESWEITLFETNIINIKQYENILFFLKDYFGDEFKNNIKFNWDFTELWKIETDENWKFKIEDARSIIVFIKLSNNLKVIWTINEDETTQSISNKVLDRAQFITFEVWDLFWDINGEFVFPESEIDLVNYKYKNYNEIQSHDIFNQLVRNHKTNSSDKISEILNKVNKLIIKINPNESIAYRVVWDIWNYLKEFTNYEESKNFDELQKAFDYQVAQKVLTKLKTFNLNNDSQKNAFKEIWEIFWFEFANKNNIEEMKWFDNYPKTLKFYNYLYSNLLDD